MISVSEIHASSNLLLSGTYAKVQLNKCHVSYSNKLKGHAEAHHHTIPWHLP